MALLPFLWQDALLSWSILPPLAGFAFFGMSGQLTFFLALRYAQSSQVTPLLALKILIIAGGSVLFLQKNLSLLQWLSVAICFIAALTLNFSGVAMLVRALFYVLVTCCAYTCADICVTLLIRRLEALAVAHTCLVATCLSYGVAGIVGALLMFKIWHDLRLTRPGKYALYFSSVFSGSHLHFCHVQTRWPGFGQYSQSTRGVASVLLANIIARKNMAYLEQRPDRCDHTPLTGRRAVDVA